MHDVIIIGGGHNGLTAAAYLARAGRKVLVLERSNEVGGAAVTGEIAPGYRVSTASYLISLLLPEVERELELARHGYKVLPRSPSSFTPLEDGRSLLMGPDMELNRREIARFSARDAEAYDRYARDLLHDPFYRRLERHSLQLALYAAVAALFFAARPVDGNLLD